MERPWINVISEKLKYRKKLLLMLKKKKPNSERKASCTGTCLWIDGGSWGYVIESTGLSAEEGLALQGP